MTENVQPLHPSQAASAKPRRSRRLRGLLRRLGGLLRHRINNPLQAILSEAEMLAERGANDEMDVQAAAHAIEAAARRIAAVVADFEQLAAREIEDEAAAQGVDVDPAPLTRALAAELNLIARHAETALHAQDAERLRPRLRRAARLAHAWLATGDRLRPRYAPPPETPPSPPEPTPAAPAHHGSSAAARALAFRLQRLEAEHRRLQEHLERRERFWRFATHELRNAANAFVSWAYVLRRSEIRNAPWFAPLARAAEAMLRRTEEALELEGGRTDFEVRVENVNLVEAARDALEMIRPTADQNNLTLALASPPGGEPVWAEADPDRLQQILQNLLRNAVDATPAGGSICITARHEGAFAALEVEDTGSGVQPGTAAGPFQGRPPADPPAGRRRGYGLGLPLSRYLAEQMRGSLEFQSAAAGGARLLLRLPRANP